MQRFIINMGGFLHALLINISFSSDFLEFWKSIGNCNAWIGWIMTNVLLHLTWVILLTICQTYQVVCLGMTTNERMNRGRYRHFQAKDGKSPFTRGPIRNLADFLGCSCFGLVPSKDIDWMNYYDFEVSSNRTIEQEPLLGGGGSDEPSSAAFQYV